MSQPSQFNPPRVEGVMEPVIDYTPAVPPSIYECPSCGLRGSVPVESNLLQISYYVPGKQPYSIEYKACHNCLKATVEIFNQCFKTERINRGISLRKIREQERTRPCGCG